MLTVSDEVQIECPQCANRTMYVEATAMRPHDAAVCRCGKCGCLRLYSPEQQKTPA